MSSTTQTFKWEFNIKTGKQGILKYLFIPGFITIQMNFASSSNFNFKVSISILHIRDITNLADNET